MKKVKKKKIIFRVQGIHAELVLMYNFFWLSLFGGMLPIVRVLKKMEKDGLKIFLT